MFRRDGLDELDRALLEGTRAEAECRAELDTATAELTSVGLTLTRAEETAASWRERVAAQSTLVTERRVRLAQVREQSGAARESALRIS